MPCGLLRGDGRSQRRRVPMLVGSAVDDAPLVVPDRRVLLAGLARIVVLHSEHDADDVAARQHGHERHGQLVARRRPRQPAEILHHVVAPRHDVRIVLKIALGEPTVGLVPVVALQELAQDVQHDLLVGVLRRVRVREQRFGIRGRDDGLLRANRTERRQRRQRQDDVTSSSLRHPALEVSGVVGAALPLVTGDLAGTGTAAVTA